MNVRLYRPRLVRSLALLAVLSASGCALLRPPEPRPWIPGSYDFHAPLDGESITGTIEVEAEGPMRATTSLGPCQAPLGESYRPWKPSRTFLCAGDHRMVVNVGTRSGPPITGTLSSSRTVTRYEYVERCVRYESTEEGGRTCAEWEQEVRAVNERSSARILLVESEDSAGGR
jgi:hypothetical protein